MAFYETPRFPAAIAYGATGGPQWRTTVVVTAGGAQVRNAEWQYPQHRWDVSSAIKTQAEFELVRAHFMSVRGRLHGFRFRDFADHSAAHAGTDRGVVAGLTSTTFALVKRYVSGAQYADRRIRKPIAAGFELRDLGTPLTLTTHYTLDSTTGIVTTTTPRTAADLTWAGEFDTPCRYDVDALRGAIVSRNPTHGLLHEWDEIAIVELPL